MVKFEAGMYIRYKNFANVSKIAKITKIVLSDNDCYENYYHFDNDDGTLEGFIEKASYNIIDLLEVRDYVNGSEVDDFVRTYNIENDEPILKGVVTNDCYLENSLNSWLEEKDIESVVTKEQFEAMQYVI